MPFPFLVVHLAPHPCVAGYLSSLLGASLLSERSCGIAFMRSAAHVHKVVSFCLILRLLPSLDGQKGGRGPFADHACA